jgi:prolyl oligopeptidase
MGPLPRIATSRGQQVDAYHGERVADPYRWLEDTNDPETLNWVGSQNERTEAFLSGVPSREAILARLTQIWDFPRAGAPFERGGRWFQLRNSGLQDQAVLYVMSAPDGTDGEVLLDPNLLSEDGTVAVPDIAVSEDGSLLAYATSAAGSDWTTWHVRDVASEVDRPDVVEWSKFGTASWRRDGSGFYYSAIEKPKAGEEYTGKLGELRIFFHALGTAQSDDELVFEPPPGREWLPRASISEDGNFLVISISVGTAPQNRLEVLDLSLPGLEFAPLVEDFESTAEVVTNVGTTFFLVTDDNAPRQRVVAVDLERPERQNWREVLGETEAVLLGARNCGGRLVCHYLQDACSRLSVFELDGSHVAELPLPAVASVVQDSNGGSGIEGRAQSKLVHFELSSFTDTGSLWSHDLVTGQTRALRAAAGLITPDDYVSEQIMVTASDGARVPLFLTHRRDVTATGDVPVLLYGYGGFNIAITPKFDKANMLFVERGGLLAVAVLRGGGEYGRAWHDSGRLAQKQRVFDDFCDCARWLSSSGWSRPEKIGINGASNGGLLVGACLTQHPELFGAAVAEVGVMDMLRFHKFTIGWAWKSDFGDPDDPEQYPWLRAYSPLHNIEPGANYPPTLIMTGDHDDRVVPGHSFKFAAALQAGQRLDDPTPLLIRVGTSAGHGLGKPTSKSIAERADVLAFLDAALRGTTAPGPN